MQDALYFLTVVEGPASGKTIPLSEGEYTIGRSSTCDYQISDDTEISRQHVRVGMIRGELTVEDLGSTHGSYLNNTRLQGKSTLVPGDLIKLGHTMLRLDLPTISATETELQLGTIVAGEDAPPPGLDMPLPARPVVSRTPVTAAEDDGPATQFNDNILGMVENVDGPATRMFQQEQTRMMEGKELEGLRATKKPAGGKYRPLIGLVLVTAIIIGALAAFKLRSDKNAVPLYTELALPDYNVQLVHPRSWKVERGAGDQVALIKLNDFTSGRQIGQISVRGVENVDYRYSAQREAFTDFMKETAAIYEGFNLIRSGDTQVNNISGIRYKFTTTEHSGSGIFFLNREQRIVIEALALRKAWAEQEPHVEDFFGRTRLLSQQILLNFPNPTDGMKQDALKSPAKVEEVARRLMEQGDNLVKNKSVRPSNMYYGRNAYRECLQWCSALTTRPAFYQEAARKLVTTVNDLDGDLFQQNALILQALKVRDYQSACAECQRMVQMIPDPTHDYHRRAMEAIDRFCSR